MAVVSRLAETLAPTALPSHYFTTLSAVGQAMRYVGHNDQREPYIRTTAWP